MNKSIFCVLTLGMLTGCSPAPAPSTAPSISIGTVTMEVVSQGDVEVFEFPGVASGTTLESLLREIDDPPIKLKGSGTTAFVESIGDVATSASDGWTFRVDGQFANEGVGATILQPPTTIEWKYGSFADQPE